MRNLTTRLVILLVLALMIITGVYDYIRLGRERERIVEQTQEDVRIFAETLALAVSRNVRWGRTTNELKELLMEREYRDAIREKVLSRLVVLGLFVLSIFALTRWSIARPIQALIAGARAVGRGDLTQRIVLTRRDEIGQLGEEFYRMAESLQAAQAQIVAEGQARLELERQVQQAQKLAAVGMLAAEVAHEIGTPLNIISGRAEVLERVVGREHPERRHLEVILNLLLNALDASPAGETVRVTTGPHPVLPAEGQAGIVRGKVDGPCLAIHVRDAGKGMTAEQLDHAFEPFFSTKARGHGTGLGLPIVEEIVRAHWGEIEMLSIPGRGTEVIVRLPLAPDGTEPRDPTPRVSAPAPSQG